MSSLAPVAGDPQVLVGEAREIYAQLGHAHGIMDCRLAQCHFMSAADSLEEAQSLFTMAEQHRDFLRMAEASRWIARGLDRLGRHAEAVFACKRAISIFRGSVDDKPSRFVAICLLNIAEMHWKLGDLKSVVLYYEESLALNEAVNNADGAHIVCTYLADTFLVMGRPLAAIEFAERAMAMRTAAVFRSYVHCVLI
ncbi:hypothetical protein AURDEDRAFT_163390 [Auricularia subglabra TFB-10046 SS5]|nr:hypothetical protein AURDEDRAFT_163390 [Auricularia subglabra TFB-10046 SS5]